MKRYPLAAAKRIVIAVTVLVMSACGGPTRKTVAWHVDASGAVVCPDADWRNDWTRADGVAEVDCRWTCVGNYRGEIDRDVIVAIQRVLGGSWVETPGAGVAAGCH